MSIRNYTTFRVRGIPVNWSKVIVQEQIANASSSRSSSGVQVWSLAVDRSRVSQGDTSTATVTLDGDPDHFLCPNGPDRWTLEVSRDLKLYFDTHFHGWTPLHCPSEDGWSFDLVAISGMNGHAFGSFKQKGGSYMWLRDGLPQKFPGARVIVYGYDSRLPNSASFQNIRDIGRKFQDNLRNLRLDPEKPLVLLGHSLGGIVVNEAVLLMRDRAEDLDQKTLDAITGIFFFGIPSQGLDVTSLVQMVGDQPNRGFLHSLEHNSQALQTQSRELSQALSDLQCELVYFYETRESPTPVENEDGIWSMSGAPKVLVNAHSATHGCVRDTSRHHVHPVDCTHSELVKFSDPFDETYEIFMGYLSDMLRKQSKLSKLQKACLQSLAFPKQHMRKEALRPAKGTCAWITTHETFVDWYTSPNALLWIRGKPGSGKSMMMKWLVSFMEDNASEDEIVISFFIYGQGNSLQSSRLGVYRSLIYQLYGRIPDVFSDLTRKFEKNTDTPCQWSWQRRELQTIFLKNIPEACKRKSIVLLVDALDEAREPGARETEARETEAREIVSDLQKLMTSLDSSVSRLRVCLSCRHYPEVDINCGKTLVMEHVNRLDIERVVGMHLGSTSRFTSAEKEEIRRAIPGRSDGIFQWAELIYQSVLQSTRDGDSFDIAMRWLKQAPKSLDTLYRAILEPKDQLDEEYTARQRLKLFQLVSLAGRLLSPKELQHALCFNGEQGHGNTSTSINNNRDFIREKDMDLKLKSLSRGLIHKKGAFDSGTVQFIHQSVADYVKRSGLQLLSEKSHESSEDPHLQISKLCLSYLEMPEVGMKLQDIENMDSIHPYLDRSTDDLWDSKIMEILNRLPLLSYAWNYWVYHAYLSRDSQKMGKHLSEFFGRPRKDVSFVTWASRRKALGYPLKAWAQTCFAEECLPYFPGVGHAPWDQPLHWPNPGSGLAHFLAICGFSSTLKDIIKHSNNTSLTDYGIPMLLEYAISGNQVGTLRMLLESTKGVQDVNSSVTMPVHDSLLHTAAKYGHAHCITSLWDLGYGVNDRAEDGDTPLHEATNWGSSTAAVEALINIGADIDAKNNHGDTPLHNALRLIRKDSAKLLIAAGANPLLRNRSGATPLESAILEPEFGAEGLIAARMNVQATGDVGNTALHITSLVKDIKGVKALLRANADVRVQNHEKRTPLHFAVECGKKIRSWGTEWKSTSVIIVKLLLESGAEINAADELGHTPLHRAASQGELECVETLIQSSCDVNIRDLKGEIALMHAMARGTSWVLSLPMYGGREANIKVVEALIQSGSDLDIQNLEGETALMLAIKYGDDEFAEALIQAGCNLDIRNLDGKTALMLAVQRIRPRVVQTLLKWGASCAQDNNVVPHIPQLSSLDLGPFGDVPEFLAVVESLFKHDGVGQMTNKQEREMQRAIDMVCEGRLGRLVKIEKLLRPKKRITEGIKLRMKELELDYRERKRRASMS